MSATHRFTRRATHLAPAVPVALLSLALSGLALAGPASAAPAALVVDDSSVGATTLGQFSDPLSLAFSATSGAGAVTAAPTGLPSGLTLTQTGTSSAAQFAVTGTTSADPGTYPVSITVTDGSTSDVVATDVVIAQEAATVSFTGRTLFTAGDYDDDEVSVTLSAVVDQEADGNLGAINGAEVVFTDTQTGEELCDDATPAVQTGAGQGAASCSFDADLSDFDSVQYTVRTTVEGDYIGQSAGDTIITTQLPEEPDEDAPETKITSGPSGWLLDTTATFGYSSSAEDSDFICKLDSSKVACKDPSVTLKGLAKRSHSFEVVAEDEYGERDETPATRDFAVPLDDGGLAVASGKWKRKKGGDSYQGTYSETKKKGATLSYKINGARELALLVYTGKKFGAVKVYLDGQLLSTVKTATGGKATSRLVKLEDFTKATSGVVKIVTTNSKTVRIDGLGVSTEAF